MSEVHVIDATWRIFSAVMYGAVSAPALTARSPVTGGFVHRPLLGARDDVVVHERHSGHQKRTSKFTDRLLGGETTSDSSPIASSHPVPMLWCSTA